MNVSSTWIMRQLRWIGSGRNPLATRWDRIETALVAVAIVLSLGMVPVALAAGSHEYATGLRDAAHEQATRTQVTAVLLADAPETLSARATATQVPVKAVWRLPDGSERTGQVEVAPGTDAGTGTPIWIDQAGNSVPEPLTRDGALGAAFGIAALVWVGAVGLVVLALWGARFLLDRRRGEDLAREWQRASRDLKRF
ncbi:Rv1733c family protein [Amycolatopsis alkalitolerans]|uniref:Transmembrane protein n=1 Tax=Amycolatopsis alkalitolerans TaxID=2547244 RepID=A0A5C4LPD7_9PSEU|nr:hypothetical protein [Amycolatopsis alkalitolerans]TNC19335.1 hypothetical protein FG385_32495 [Amycolatopsis alkalitolerans]